MELGTSLETSELQNVPTLTFSAFVDVFKKHCVIDTVFLRLSEPYAQLGVMQIDRQLNSILFQKYITAKKDGRVYRKRNIVIIGKCQTRITGKV